MAYHIIHQDTVYLKDDSVGYTANAFTPNYSDRKTYSTESAATTVMNSLSAAPESIKVVEE